ncbi:MAG: hypothetical protein Q8911_00450 [Bacillota bacterium]|nr:hypothetical protein [Bacillota bacterium]
MPATEKDFKTIPVRIPLDKHKEFMKKLIDDDKSAQTFFIEKVEEYLGKKL